MKLQKTSLFMLIGIVTVLCFLMISPFLGYLLTGVILAFILHPAKKKLESYTRYSSALLVILTVFMAILPLLFTITAVANDASNMIRSIDNQNLSLDFVEETIAAVTGNQVDLKLEERLKSSLKAIGGTVVSSTSQIVGMATSFLIGISLLLFTEYYMLKQGSEIVKWTKELDLLPEDLQDKLYSKTSRTTRTVIKGHVITAMVSGFVAGIGLLIAGMSNVIFWTFLMMILGLIPLVGTTLIWGPAGIYLLISGQIYEGAFVLAWGIIAVGSVDNFLRPFLVDEGADLHPMFIIIGVIGGIGVFGPVGVFVGPVLFGIWKSLITIYTDHYHRFK